jgi:6-phospho-3-hexuloisomerase
MRLFHLGLRAAVVGDMTTPHLGAGDLLILSAGPGVFSTVEALMSVATKSGARTLVVTAQFGGSASRAADIVLVIPAQTNGERSSTLDFGSADGVIVRGRRACSL